MEKGLLGLWCRAKEEEKYWLSALTERNDCGLQDVLVGCGGLTGFPEAMAFA